MLKRLIEVALPLKEVSEQSAREKSIRHGHISTLHIWWARRPLAACRAAVFASLIPDPDDAECPESFRKLVGEILGPGDKPEHMSKWLPKNVDGAPLEDTPRNRCLEFIKHLVKWENSNNPEYIEPARKLIAAAHKFLHPNAEGVPASLIDVLHRMCAFREKGDTEGMAQFLGRSGHGNNQSLWLVAQAVSEILPDGDKEKQLMQGLLNQKEGLEETARQGRLF
jgi:hypothetical protein